MALTAASQPFRPDSRGNRLDAWDWTSESQTHTLWLRGSQAIADQLANSGLGYQQLVLPPERRAVWTHVLRGQGRAPSEAEAAMLNLLQRVVTLPSPSNVETALALDWYKKPDPNIDSYSWPNTEAAELLASGKYRYRNNETKKREVGRQLVVMMNESIECHPSFSDATLVADVPGHDSQQVGYGSRMASTVASLRSLGRVVVRSKDAYRVQAKDASEVDRAAMLDGQFYVDVDLSGHTVLVIDDVFKTGLSMAEAARALSAAGAERVLGFCAVRTMRRS